MATRKTPRTTANARAPRPANVRDTPELDDTDELPDTPEPDDTPELAGSALAARFSGASGDDLLEKARRHLGEDYVLGARAPMANGAWTGPWDCAEFVSWCVFQASGVLYGTKPRNDPMLADAFTGFWADQAQAGGHTIPVGEAAAIPGAAVLRRAVGAQIGHIVFSDGMGGTVEAHSRARGVIAGTLSGRRWDHGVLVPGIRYFRAEGLPPLEPAGEVLHLTRPLMRGEGIREVQRRLAAHGLFPGQADGVFGPQTAHAVRLFQAREGLVADGEVGPLTLLALRRE